MYIFSIPYAPNSDPEPEEAPLTAFGNYDRIKDGIKVS
jgi:hypothetical protein